MKIPSSTGNHWAILRDHPEGVQVEIWRRTRNSYGASARLGVWVLPCPFHDACTRIHDLMWDLPDEPPAVSHTARKML